ncbi:MAG TPA: DoxX family protein [Myxococcaceae bacterium]|nr:DoxX family protein [Myxococcaceae bacterium]
MISLFVLLGSFIGFRLAGALGVDAFNGWSASGRWALAAMFIFTGMSHFFPAMRQDFIRMVPPVLGAPGFWVAFTGACEIAGALGLLFPSTRPYAAWALAALLIALFPANFYAASKGLTLAGREAAPLMVRAPMQVLYIAWAIWVARS